MKIAINGFGRIGRMIFKLAHEKGLDIVAINDLHGTEAARYLLEHDSVYGTYKQDVKIKGNYLIVNGKKTLIVSEKDPFNLPWRKLGVDVVIESTGAFTDGKNAVAHIKSGAKKVLITAPAKNHDVTIVPGVNDSSLKKDHKIISVGSCTTNCTAPIAKIILDNFGINWSMLTTVHAYTNDQVLQDSFHKNVRRGRSAANNIIPTTTGAAEAVLEVIPELKGRMTGLSVRVPVPCGSLIDFTAEVKKKVSPSLVNSAIRKASKSNFKGLVLYSEEPLVSSDIIGNPYSAIVDSLSTQVDGNLVKVLAWYDNEFGYSSRVVDVLKRLK